MKSSVMDQMILGSPVLLATVLPALLVALLLVLGRRTRARLIYEMDEAAFALGQAA